MKLLFGKPFFLCGQLYQLSGRKRIIISPKHCAPIPMQLLTVLLSVIEYSLLYWLVVKTLQGDLLCNLILDTFHLMQNEAISFHSFA